MDIQNLRKLAGITESTTTSDKTIWQLKVAMEALRWISNVQAAPREEYIAHAKAAIARIKELEHE